MESKVTLECASLKTERTFTLNQANKLLKLQGNSPDGWSLKSGQKYHLDEHGTIIRGNKKASQAAPEPGSAE